MWTESNVGRESHRGYGWSSNGKQSCEQRQAPFPGCYMYSCLSIAIGMAHKGTHCTPSCAQQPDCNIVPVCHSSSHQGCPPITIQASILHTMQQNLQHTTNHAHNTALTPRLKSGSYQQYSRTCSIDIVLQVTTPTWKDTK